MELADNKEQTNKLEFYQKLIQQKSVNESRFVLCLYQQPDLYYDYDTKGLVFHDRAWKFYYDLLSNLVVKRQVVTMDSVTVEAYVESQTQEYQDQYENYGGYETIDRGLEIVETTNVNSYYREIQRYNVLFNLIKFGYPVQKNWAKIETKDLQQLSDYFESKMQEVFLNTTLGSDKVVDLMRGMDKMVVKADEGKMAGLPLTSKLMNSVQNGLRLGNITMLGAHSGVGKSFMTTLQHVTSCIAQKEPILIIANEEDADKWQQELLTCYINNNYPNAHFNKGRFYHGGFDDTEKRMLNKGVVRYRDLPDNLVRFVSMSQFSMNKTISLIKQYAKAYGVKYFVLDTMKLDNDTAEKVSDNSWLQMQQNMVRLYNTIKESNLNVHVWVTTQLSKGKANSRFLDQSNIGIAKNIVDVASSVMLMRTLTNSEKDPTSKTKLIVKDSRGNEVHLDPDEEYVIIFWAKNRQGSIFDQVVLKVNRGENTFSDIGTCRLDRDLE